MNRIKITKTIISIIIVLIVLILIVFVSLYVAEEKYRNWIDEHILRKDITQEDVVSVDLNTDQNNQIYVYDKHLAILNKQNITLYNHYGEKETSINVNINNALFDSDEKYLVVAEDGGNEICLILDKTYLWSNKLDGEIMLVNVNRNGYVAVITKDITYSSILTVYNPDGTELFRSFFATTRIIDASISRDNKYVALGEIDTSGAVIQSNVKIISIDNAKENNNQDPIIYTYNAESGKLLTNVKYQDKGIIVCMYDNSIDIIQNEENKQLLEIDENKTTFLSTELNDYAVYVQENTAGVFKTNSEIKIINLQNAQVNTYNLEDILKELYAKDDVIVANVGNEIYFINKNGWLIRKYSTKQEITNVIFSNNLAAVVYKDKIELIDL